MMSSSSDKEKNFFPWNMCRTCGGEAEISIYDNEGVERQLEEKINTYLPITVSLDDYLPLALCQKCVDRIESCHQIVTSCIETEAQLKEVMKLENNFQPDEECKNNSKHTALSLYDGAQLSSTVEEIEKDDSQSAYINCIILTQNKNNPNEKKEVVDDIFSRGNSIEEESNESVTHDFTSKKLKSNNVIYQSGDFKFGTANEKDYSTHIITHCNKNIKKYNGFTCDLCNKNLSSKLSLRLHLRTHSGERPFRCKFCNKNFSQKPALKYHERKHTGEHPFVCCYCGKGFNSRVIQETHERVHTGERPFCCEKCGSSFRCVSNLRQHQAIHSDLRPYVCHVCGKNFRRPEKVRIHMRIHTGERPYSCPLCKRAFTQKGDMLKHTLIHSKSKN